jgi:hypothetical protein
MNDASIWSMSLELSITILEALFTLIYDVYSRGIANDDSQVTIVICLWHRPKINW